MNKIGIYGGTFDPVHKGHIGLAKDALEECKLDKVIFLPAFIQPFKIGKESTSSDHRFNMVKAAISEDDRFEVSDYELKKGEISYSYDTLRAFEKIYSGKLYFIMGDDSFVALESWFKGDELLKNFSFIVGNRPGMDREDTLKLMERYKEKYGTDAKLIDNELVDVSATELREALRTGRNVEKFLTDSVIEYINENRLYR